MNSIIKYIVKQVSDNKLDAADAKILLGELKDSQTTVTSEIAVVGMSCRLPQADSPEVFWENIAGGKNCIIPFPEERKVLPSDRFNEELYTPAGYLEKIDTFDAAFFRIPPQEAEWMAPSHRLMVETMWSAVEDGGITRENIKGTNTGVYIGQDHCLGKDYRDYCIDLKNQDPLVTTGSYPGLLSGRISYLFDLKGPSLVVDTACSSGLVAAHLACDALKKGECDQALVGGVFVRSTGVNDGGLSIVSGNTLRCFDQDSVGTLWGEGVVSLLLKPLEKAIEDNDNIHGVIKGSAINNDGGMTSGLTAPNALSQEKLMSKVWKNLSLNPESISYIESHGTGTKIGDPIEINAIKNAFSRYTSRKQFCALGSVKPNIGHTVSASGLVSLVKVLMALKKKKLPATINFNNPNSFIDFCNSPVFINDTTTDWVSLGEPRIAGVNAFGFSGTNCHMIIGEYEDDKSEVRTREGKGNALSSHLFLFSAKDEESLSKLVGRYISFLEGNPSLTEEELSYMLAHTREHYPCRLTIIASSIRELIRKLGTLKGGLFSNRDNQIRFGHYRVVSQVQPSSDIPCVTHAKKQELREKLEGELAENEKMKSDPDFFREILADYYCLGVDFFWTGALFPEMKFRKKSLPTYAYKSTRYWARKGEDLKGGVTHRSPVVDREKPLLREIVIKGRTSRSGYTENEIKLAHIWGMVLGYSEVDIYDGFYDLGGDSINLIRIIDAIRLEMNIDVGLHLFLEKENIHNLGEYLDEIEPEELHIEKLPDTGEENPFAGDKYDPFPLTEVQHAYLVGRDRKYEMGGVATHVYTEYITSLDILRLNGALNRVIARHPMLRTVFLPEGKQRFLNTVPEYQIRTDDISFFTKEEQENRILSERELYSHHVYDTAEWPLFLFRALKLSEEKYYLFIGFDMLIADGLSLQIICREMMGFYGDSSVAYPKLEYTFRDYILQKEKYKTSSRYLVDKEFWSKKLDNFPSPPSLPMKGNPESIESPRFRRLEKTISKHDLDSLKKNGRFEKDIPGFRPVYSLCGDSGIMVQPV